MPESPYRRKTCTILNSTGVLYDHLTPIAANRIWSEMLVKSGILNSNPMTRADAYEERKPTERVCLDCGAVFLHKHPAAKYCDKCALKHSIYTHRARAILASTG